MTMSASDRNRRRGGKGDGDLIDTATLVWVQELCADALKSARPTDWERNFCADIAARAIQFRTRLRISEKQQAMLLRIEEKIHAAG
jgi:hypothetical protein